MLEIFFVVQLAICGQIDKLGDSSIDKSFSVLENTEIRVRKQGSPREGGADMRHISSLRNIVLIIRRI